MERVFPAPAQHYPGKLSPEGGGCPGDPEEGRQLQRAISVGTPPGLSTHPRKNLLRTLPSITRGKSKAGVWTRGWAVKCLSLFIHPSQSPVLGSSVTLTLTEGTGTPAKCAVVPTGAAPHGHAGVEGLCSSPISVTLLVCCHSQAKHHWRFSLLQCSFPTLSMSHNIRSSILDYFQNTLQLH